MGSELREKSEGCGTSVCYRTRSLTEPNTRAVLHGQPIQILYATRQPTRRCKDLGQRGHPLVTPTPQRVGHPDHLSELRIRHQPYVNFDELDSQDLPRNRKGSLDNSSGFAGFNEEPAAHISDALAHSCDTDAEQRLSRVECCQGVRRNPTTSVNDLDFNAIRHQVKRNTG